MPYKSQNYNIGEIRQIDRWLAYDITEIAALFDLAKSAAISLNQPRANRLFGSLFVYIIDFKNLLTGS